MNNRKKLNIKPNEFYALVLSFIYFFCVLSAYYIIRPIREQLSAEVGSTQLPEFFTTTFIVTLLLTPLFSWLMSYWSRRFVIPLVYLFFIACELAFVPFFLDSTLVVPRTLGLVFFVWVSVFNLFIVSVFWSFMTDIWSDKQARRLFPIIAMGGTVGAIMGPFITSQLVELIGVGFLLIVSASLLFLAIVCVLFLNQWADKNDIRLLHENGKNLIGGGMFDGLKQIFFNPFIRNMAFLMLLSDAIGTIAYVLIIDYAGSTFTDAIDRTRFAAHVDLVTNIIQIIVQITFTRWLLVKGGVKLVVTAWTIVNFVACMALAYVKNPYTPIIGSMPWVAIMVIVTRSLSHGMMKPACETLFTLVPRTLRYKGKNAIDTVVWRAGDVASSVSINALKTIGINISGFGIIGAAFIVISGAIGWNLTNKAENEEILSNTKRIS